MATPLPPYTLLGDLGETADAVIHRGLRTSDGAAVWIKIPKGGAPGPRELARIKLEYQTTLTLDVPGVVKALGYYRSGDALGLVLEDFGGRPLRDLLQGGKLALGTALWIFVNVAGTLAKVHARGVVHKRVTPESIIVDLGGRNVGLSDFSAA